MLKYYTVQIRGFSLFSVTPVTLSFTSPKKNSPCLQTDKWVVGRFIYTREIEYSAQKNEVSSYNSKEEFHSLQDISLFPITHCCPFQYLPMRVNTTTPLIYILNTWLVIAKQTHVFQILKTLPIISWISIMTLRSSGKLVVPIMSTTNVHIFMWRSHVENNHLSAALASTHKARNLCCHP